MICVFDVYSCCCCRCCLFFKRYSPFLFRLLNRTIFIFYLSDISVNASLLVQHFLTHTFFLPFNNTIKNIQRFFHSLHKKMTKKQQQISKQVDGSKLFFITKKTKLVHIFTILWSSFALVVLKMLKVCRVIFQVMQKMFEYIYIFFLLVRAQKLIDKLVSDIYFVSFTLYMCNRIGFFKCILLLLWTFMKEFQLSCDKLPTNSSIDTLSRICFFFLRSSFFNI